MPISYVEDIASEYYRLKGYLIFRSIKYQVPRTETGKKASGWKDIDILALNEIETLAIECKSFTGLKKAEDMAEELLENFKYAEKFYIQKTPLVKDKKIRKILVVDWAVKRVDNILKTKGIEIYHLNDLMKDFLAVLKTKLKTARVGKEDHPMTRTLIFLLNGGFLKDNLEEI